jgi:hypothetical protein
MKIKLLVILTSLVVFAGLVSFKVGVNDPSTAATVTMVSGKGESEGFLISYGDGTTEIKPFKWKLTPGDMPNQQVGATQLIHYLNSKGYHYSGMATTWGSFMVFEKK